MSFSKAVSSYGGSKAKGLLPIESPKEEKRKQIGGWIKLFVQVWDTLR